MAKHLAILGSGPIGIEAALYGRALGHAVTLYERGPSAAANVADWGHVHLFSPWRMNTTPLGVETLRRAGRWPEFPADVCPSGEEFREHYLLPLAESEALFDCLKVDTTVLRIGREQHHKADAIGKLERAGGGFRLLVETTDGRQRIDHADVVLDCTGTYGITGGRGGAGSPRQGRTCWKTKSITRCRTRWGMTARGSRTGTRCCWGAGIRQRRF
jgi:glycine/D-amino acid oxidase-like deaminating enzyme